MISPIAENAPAAAARPARRWWPRVRFSLRTLLLAVLSIAAAATFWWNRWPWVPAFSITVPYRFDSAQFSSDDKYLIVHQQVPLSNPGGLVPPPENVLTIYRADTGQLCRTLKPDNGFFSAYTTGPFIVLNDNRDCCVHLPVYGIEPETPSPPIDGYIRGFECTRRFFTYWHANSGTKLFRLADQKEVDGFHGGQHLTFSPDDRWIVPSFGGIRLIATDTPRRVMPPLPVTGEIQFSYFARRANLLVISSKDDGKPNSWLIDPDSGIVLQKFDAYLSFLSDDGKLGILRDAKNEAWLIETQSAKPSIPLETSQEFTPFTPHDTLFIPSRCRMLDGHTGRTLWEKQGVKATLSANRSFVVTMEPGAPQILDARSGECLFDLASYRWRNVTSADCSISFDHQDRRFVTTTRYNKDAPTESRQLTVWNLRHPPVLHGYVWMPEFWIMCLLGAGLIWSVWRDRRPVRGAVAR